jgi:hypothetical protein
MTRRTIGLGIIAFWVLGLALLYRRSSFRSPEQALAEAGMRVSPATYYYQLVRSGTQVGVASSTIDTTTALLVATDFVRVGIPGAKDTFRMQARSEARFSRALSLKDFILKVEGDLTPYLLRGVIQGEGKSRTFQLTTEKLKRRPTTSEYDVAGLVFVPTVAPVPLMLGRSPLVGATMAVGVFDPISRILQQVNLRIRKDSLFTLADSAVLDSTRGRWISAHTDTVRGWEINGDIPSVSAWVDGSGRLIAATAADGMSVVRTPFEVAFENWRLDTYSADSVRKSLRRASAKARSRQTH